MVTPSKSSKSWGRKSPRKGYTSNVLKRGQSPNTHANKLAGQRSPYVEFHSFEEPSTVDLVLIPSSLIGGYPKANVISVVGAPKSGKTVYAIQEAINASRREKDVLYIYNESVKGSFMRTVNAQRKRMNVPVSALKNIRFYDANGVILKSATYNAITSFIKNIYLKKIETYMLSHEPELIIVDSFSKIVRTYPAQAFYAAQEFIGGIKYIMDHLKKYPVVLTINQKSGGIRERNDESVLGGYGIVHDMDGSIVFRVRTADIWDNRQFGFGVGQLVHTVQIMEMRDIDCNTDERVVEIGDRGLVIRKSLNELLEIKKAEVEKAAKGNLKDMVTYGKWTKAVR